MPFFLHCHAASCLAVLGALLCRDVSGLGRSEGLSGTGETGCITALMKSVSSDCTLGQPEVHQHCLTIAQSRRRQMGGGDSKMGTYLVVFSCDAA